MYILVFDKLSAKGHYSFSENDILLPNKWECGKDVTAAGGYSKMQKTAKFMFLQTWRSFPMLFQLF